MKQRIFLVAGILLCSGAIFAAGPDEGTPALRLKALKAERLAAHPQAAAPATTVKTVSVDCTKKDSISAALEQNAGPLVIELRGICRENVRIERNDITLRGANPLTDGIRGVTVDPQPMALELYYANRTRLQNISVSDSPGGGVGAWFSALDMLNCRIERNGGGGIRINSATGFTGTELVVSQNIGAGIISQRQAFVTCTGCRLEGNINWAARSRLAGVMTLLDSVVSGVQGIEAFDAGSYVDVDCVSVVSSYPCSINVQQDAARATGGGIANLWGVGPFTGRVRAFTGGEVGVYGGQQPFVAESMNPISDYGRLATGIAEDNGSPTTLGRTVLSTFAHALLRDSTVLSGTLECSSGADAWSDTPYPPAKVVNCQNVPTTP